MPTSKTLHRTWVDCPPNTLPVHDSHEVVPTTWWFRVFPEKHSTFHLLPSKVRLKPGLVSEHHADSGSREALLKDLDTFLAHNTRFYWGSYNLSLAEAILSNGCQWSAFLLAKMLQKTNCRVHNSLFCTHAYFFRELSKTAQYVFFCRELETILIMVFDKSLYSDISFEPRRQPVKSDAQRDFNSLTCLATCTLYGLDVNHAADATE